MTIIIPDKTTKQWTTSPAGDLFGNLIRTRNLDFNKKGYLTLARKPYVFYSKLENSAFTAPICIQCDNSYAYVITTSSMWTFQTGVPGVTGTRNNTGTVPTFGFCSDGVFFQGIFVASGTATIGSLDAPGGTWTQRITGLSTSYPHPLCVSEHQQYLAVGNGNAVALYDTSWTIVTTLVLPSSFVVESIRWRANLLYIATRSLNGGDAKMYIWDGSGTAAQSGYSVGADWIYSICEYDGSMAAVTSAGQLLRFNGGGFDEIANFPIYYMDAPWSSPSSTTNLVGKVASRGMVAKGKRLYINLDGAQYGQSGGMTDYINNQPGGIWIYDPSVGLYHKAGLDNFTVLSLQPSGVASNILTFGSTVNYVSGDPVMCQSQSGLSGVISSVVYYAIYVSGTTMKLALSAKDAIAGNAITITGTPGGLDLFAFNVYRSVGATRVERPGGIALVQSNVMNVFTGSEIIFGGEVNSFTASTQVDVIMSLGMGKNTGSFITPKIQAVGLTDNIKKLFAKFPAFNLPTQQISIKYRQGGAFGLPSRGAIAATAPLKATWTSSTTFTISATAYDLSGFAVGNEVEFIEGAAAGYTAHIAVIDTSSLPTVTITIDEAMPDVSSSYTSFFFVDNWIKYRTLNQTVDAKAASKGLKENSITLDPAKWVQFKIELRGFRDMNSSVSFEELSVVNEQDLKYL